MVKKEQGSGWKADEKKTNFLSAPLVWEILHHQNQNICLLYSFILLSVFHSFQCVST